MILTRKQSDLLMKMFNGSISMAIQSEIPIGQEFYEDIDTIREKLEKEYSDAIKREMVNKK